MIESQYPHLPVLYQQIIQALQPSSPGRYVDGTVGTGGHAWGILQACSPSGQLLGLDVDDSALRYARKRLEEFRDRVTLVHASYTTLEVQLARLGWKSLQGILLDLGASSLQFDTPARGFSFQQDAPLDMRFNPQSGESAADLLNRLSLRELTALLRDYGEEQKAYRIAKTILEMKPIQTTRQLVDLVGKVVGKVVGKTPGIHPATRTFQALRIAVNNELENVQGVLPQAVAALAPGGRLAVISFHSLEDRIVKQYFTRETKDCLCPPEIPICQCGHTASIKWIAHRPITAEMDEVAQNPRSRSAKLRVVEKLAG